MHRHLNNEDRAYIATFLKGRIRTTFFGILWYKEFANRITF